MWRTASHCCCWRRMNTISATTAATTSGGACGVLPVTLLSAAQWFTLSVDNLSLTYADDVRFGSVLVPLSTHMRTAACVANCRLAGHLKLCSASLYFVPRNVEEPILRIPFRATTSIVRCHTEEQCAKGCLCRGTAVLQHCLLSRRLRLAPVTGSLVSKGAGRRQLGAGGSTVAGPGERRHRPPRGAWRKGVAKGLGQRKEHRVCWPASGRTPYVSCYFTL